MAWKKGSTHAWRKTRARILARDNHECQVKVDDNCEHYANQVHHMIGRGISELDQDLQASCFYCNNQIGDPEDHKDPTPTTRTKW